MNTKVTVLGGAGVIGSHVVECLAQSDEISELVVADANAHGASALVENLENATAAKIDVTDRNNLAAVIKEADVVVNCVGPFYRFAPPIVEAAIEHGVPYVDVCDDYDTTQTLIDTYNRPAEDAGIPCIVGLGASPGLTNVIAAYAAESLDSVETIKIYVTRGITEKAGAAIPYHMMHCWLGSVPVFERGNLRMARGLVDGQEWVTFPAPFGQASVYYFGHPETVTLPRYIDGVQNVCCKGTFFPTAFREVLLQAEALGLLSDREVSVKGTAIAPMDFMASYIVSIGARMSAAITDIPSGGSVMVDVAGVSDGQPKTYRFAGTSHMREGTATPAALGAEMLAAGEITRLGVNAPEGCIPAKTFINRMLARGVFGDVWMSTTEKIVEPLA
jgi:saccharopine dehydrogenase (NAD+, L-lysine-forming)